MIASILLAELEWLMTQDTDATDWRDNGVRVIPGDKLDPNTAQTPGMYRQAAINHARVGANKIWAGTVTIHANAKTGAHHHGHLESVIYVVRGAHYPSHTLWSAWLCWVICVAAAQWLPRGARRVQTATV